MINENKAQLIKAINKVARLKGRFRLRSGKISGTYFDKYKFEADPNLLRKIAENMKLFIPENTEVLAGLEMGGIPIATMLSQLTNIPVSFVRKSAKEYGTCKYAEGADLKNKKIVLIEDVVSSGGAIIDGVEKMRKDGIFVDLAVCVIDRESGGKENLEKRGIKLISLLTKTDLES